MAPGLGTRVVGHQGTRVSRPLAPVLRQANTPRAINVPLTPVNHGHQRGPVTRPDHQSRPLTAQWAQPSKLGLAPAPRSYFRNFGTYSAQPPVDGRSEPDTTGPNEDRPLTV